MHFIKTKTKYNQILSLLKKTDHLQFLITTECFQKGEGERGVFVILTLQVQEKDIVSNRYIPVWYSTILSTCATTVVASLLATS